MAGRISGLAVAYTAAGFVLLWSGWQNVPVKGALTSFAHGTVPHGTPTGAPTLSVGSGSTPTAASSGSGSGGNAPAAPSHPTGNVAMGKMMAAADGWGSGAQWNALYALWNQESGWSTTALNSTTGATGIPQLNPNSHTVPANWSSAAVQIQWGLNYIRQRYGSPEAAWAWEKANGWY